jgi:4-hydroxythreonine-4-phosphate dehydrogenase
MAAPTVVLTTGDPAGVGPEILVKALAERDWRASMRPLVVGSARVLREAIAACRLDLAVEEVERAADAPAGPGVVAVRDVPWQGRVPYGEIDPGSGRAAVDSIELACRLIRAGEADALVTGPINKEAIWAAGVQAPGHTELLADLLGVAREDVMTMFVIGKLRIFFLTRHLPLRAAIEALHVDLVAGGIRGIARHCGPLGIEAPRIAVAALNPHAGEGGKLGTEDRDILRPAVERCRGEGIDVVGPVPSDAVFFQCREGRFDAVLSLYHDQGHIAAKTIDFFGVVACQLGLPVLRTAAEHGTALDIAGRWIADPRGQVEAMRVATELAPRAA